MNLGNFFAELKRRNVYKVAVAYPLWDPLRNDPRFRELAETDGRQK